MANLSDFLTARHSILNEQQKRTIIWNGVEYHKTSYIL